MLTTLPKHRGRNGPILAFAMLVATTTVVLLTQQPRPQPASAPPSRAIPAAPVAPEKPLPAAMAPPPVAPATSIVGTGTIGYDESKTSHLAAPAAGWLHKTRAKSLGHTVRAGETLGVVYSPEVYLTSVDVLNQLKNYASSEARDAFDAQRMHLLRLGMPPWTLTKMQQTGTPERSVPLIARVTGTVVVEEGQPTQLVDAWDVELFTITDPTRRYLYIDAPAADAARVKLGANARVTIEGMKAPVTGKVGYIYRRVEGGMRSIRIELENRTPLRVGAGATAEIKL